MKKFILLCFLPVILLPATIFAQNDSISDIITDRPTQAESPYIVPKGLFQIETGVVYTGRDDQTDSQNQWSIATTKLLTVCV